MREKLVIFARYADMYAASPARAFQLVLRGEYLRQASSAGNIDSCGANCPDQIRDWNGLSDRVARSAARQVIFQPTEWQHEESHT